MAKIYAIPDEVKAPVLDFSNIEAWQADEKRFVKEMESFTKKYNPEGGEHIGKVITFPVADSCASYMVASIKPPQLIQLPLGDNHYFQYDTKLSGKDILQKIQQSDAIDKMVEENKIRIAEAQANKK